MEKYKFENNKAVVDLPCIITVSKSSVSIEHASNTDSADIPDAGLIILVGNIESYNPTNLSPEPEPEITPIPSGGGDTPSGGGDEPGEGGETPGGDTPVTPDPTPTPTPDPSTPDYAPTPTVYSTAAYTGGNGIKFVITNNTGYEARLSGAITLNLSKNPNDWTNSTQAYAHIVDASKGIPDQNGKYHKNNIIISAGGTYTSPAITTITGIYMPSTNFTDGTWYLMNSINSPYGYPIFLYTREYSKSRSSVSSSLNMYAAAPTQNAVLLMGYTYYLNLYWKNPYASLDPDKSGDRYIILAENQENLSS